MAESNIDKQFKMILEITAKQDARLEQLEKSVQSLISGQNTLIDGQNKLISLVGKVLDVQDEQKDLIEALAIRSTQQDAEILKIKRKSNNDKAS